MYYPSSENKGANQLRGYREATAKLICVFVFAYADCWFSHGAAQMTRINQSLSPQFVFFCDAHQSLSYIHYTFLFG